MSRIRPAAIACALILGACGNDPIDDSNSTLTGGRMVTGYLVNPLSADALTLALGVSPFPLTSFVAAAKVPGSQVCLAEAVPENCVTADDSGKYTIIVPKPEQGSHDLLYTQSMDPALVPQVYEASDVFGFDAANMDYFNDYDLVDRLANVVPIDMLNQLAVTASLAASGDPNGWKAVLAKGAGVIYCDLVHTVPSTNVVLPVKGSKGLAITPLKIDVTGAAQLFQMSFDMGTKKVSFKKAALSGGPAWDAAPIGVYIGDGSNGTVTVKMTDPGPSNVIVFLDASFQNTPNKLWFIRNFVTNAQSRFH